MVKVALQEAAPPRSHFASGWRLPPNVCRDGLSSDKIRRFRGTNSMRAVGFIPRRDKPGRSH